MTGSEALIEIQNLSKTYPLGKGLSKTVFKNVSLTIRPGEFVAFLGPSGCGKSTLLRLISQLESPTSGTLHHGKSSRSGIVFQEPRLLPWQSVKENVLLPAHLGKVSLSEKNLASAQAKADQLLFQLGLAEFTDQFPQALSGGMKMRTALARALLLDPELLLLDEPLAALDEQTRAHLQMELRRLYEKSKMTFVFVTHSIREACFLAQRIFIFNPWGPQPQVVEVNLPRERTSDVSDLRETQAFFEETQRLTALFHQAVKV
jgi:NitT/TauT family transport system ATP-binding protein